MIDYKLLHRNIEGLLKKSGCKMKDLEEFAGLSNGYISRCANGKKRMSIDAVAGIASYFKVPLEDLISRELVEKSYSINVTIIGRKPDSSLYLVETESGHLLHIYPEDLNECFE